MSERQRPHFMTIKQNLKILTSYNIHIFGVLGKFANFEITVTTKS